MATSRPTRQRVDSLEPGRKVRDIRDRDLKRFGVRIVPSDRKRNVLHSQVDAEILGLAYTRSKARTMSAPRMHGDVAGSVAPNLFETAAGECFRCYGRHGNSRALEASPGHCKNMDARSWLAMPPTIDGGMTVSPNG